MPSRKSVVALKIIRKYGEQPVLGANPAFFAFYKYCSFIGMKQKFIDYSM